MLRYGVRCAFHDPFFESFDLIRVERTVILGRDQSAVHIPDESAVHCIANTDDIIETLFDADVIGEIEIARFSLDIVAFRDSAADIEERLNGPVITDLRFGKDDLLDIAHAIDGTVLACRQQRCADSDNDRYESFHIHLFFRFLQATFEL